MYQYTLDNALQLYEGETLPCMLIKCYFYRWWSYFWVDCDSREIEAYLLIIVQHRKVALLHAEPSKSHLHVQGRQEETLCDHSYKKSLLILLALSASDRANGNLTDPDDVVDRSDDVSFTSLDEHVKDNEETKNRNDVEPSDNEQSTKVRHRGIPVSAVTIKMFIHLQSC